MLWLVLFIVFVVALALAVRAFIRGLGRDMDGY